MERIAGALGTTLGQFFQESAARESTIVKVGTHAGLNSEWSQAHIAYLSPQYAGRPFDAAMITLEPGGMSGKHARPAPNEEFAFIIEGEISLTLNDQDHTLGTGDAVTILATVPRRWNNISDKRAMVLIVSVVPAS